jgi:hypothetical protein
MLKYNAKEKQKVVNNWVSKKETAVKCYLLKSKRTIVGLCALAVVCTIFFAYVLPSVSLEQLSFEVVPKELTRLSPETFRKIIGYDYNENVNIKDTANIRRSLEASDVILGEVKFSIQLIFPKLEVEFKEINPLFALMPQHLDAASLIYSDKGKIYPYSANTTDIPVVDAKHPEDIALAANFLLKMKKSDELLYTRVSQLISRNAERQITVFFNDVNFKTKFSSLSDYWEDAFRYYRQLTRNSQILDINSVAVLDLRFKQLAYTVEK